MAKTKKKQKFKKITLMLDLDIVDKLKEIAKLASVTPDQVISMILAIRILELRAESQENPNDNKNFHHDNTRR